MGFKAFKKGMICNINGVKKQYVENTEYEESGADSCCKPGVMHYCEKPFDVWYYYPIIDENGEFTEYAEVEPLAEVLVNDNKRATRRLHIGNKLSFEDFIKVGVSSIIKNIDLPETKNDSDSNKFRSSGRYAQIGSSGDDALIASSGDCAQIASSGNDAQIGSSGRYAQIASSGYYAQIGSSGDDARLGSSGNDAHIGSSGYHANIGSSGYHANIGSSGNDALIASSGDYARIGSSGRYAHIGSSGYCARIASSGDCAQIASSGDCARINVNGIDSIGAAIGFGSIAKGVIGNWIVLAEWDISSEHPIPVCVKAGKIDGKTLKPDTWYMLKKGEFVEACD